MKSAVTVSLVPEARGGPFVYWDDLPAAIDHAAKLGFDAIEIFPPGPDALDPIELKKRLSDSGLSLAAVGTGAGWVKRKLTLTHADSAIRDTAKTFVKSVIDLAGEFGAPAIIGSLQGRWGEGVSKETALARLGEAVAELGEYASRYGTFLLYEPLNRYETNLITTLAEGTRFLRESGAAHAKLLADLFHMNIEEENLAEAIRLAGSAIGHVHFVDSNRRPAGMGHTDFRPVFEALREIRYTGYLSAEAFPYPDSEAAAETTIATYRMFSGEQ